MRKSVESFIRAIQSDAQFIDATYSLIEQSGLKVKGPDLWLRLCSLNSLSIVYDQTIAIRTKKSFGFNSLGRFGYFGRFETCREYLAAEACWKYFDSARKNSIDFHSIKHLSLWSGFCLWLVVNTRHFMILTFKNRSYYFKISSVFTLKHLYIYISNIFKPKNRLPDF